MRRTAADPQNAVDRVLDVRFAIDRLARLGGRLDLDRLGVAGHSFGAATALMTAGQLLVTAAGEEQIHRDPRVQAVLAMSSPRPWRTDELARNYAAVRVPCLHFTGTLDDSPLNDTRAAERRIPFDHIVGADQILVVFAGGDHMVFTGQRRFLGDAPTDAIFQEMVRRASLAFWDATLRGDAESASFLHDGCLAGLVAGHGTVEVKRARRSP
jgi:pimeloyl-ACP methyl ester carboxylesterase